MEHRCLSPWKGAVVGGVIAFTWLELSGRIMPFHDASLPAAHVLLFAQGAEGIAVNGHRITPLSYFSGSGGEVVVDQGPPLTAPIKVQAVGNRTRMEAALDNPAALPDIRAREVQYQLQVSFSGSPDISLPANDSSLDTRHVSPL